MGIQLSKEEKFAVAVGLTLGLVGVVLLALAFGLHEQRVQAQANQNFRRVINVTPEDVTSPLRRPPSGPED
jgi:hypothetical protein